MLLYKFLTYIVCSIMASWRTLMILCLSLEDFWHGSLSSSLAWRSLGKGGMANPGGSLPLVVILQWGWGSSWELALVVILIISGNNWFPNYFVLLTFKRITYQDYFTFTFQKKFSFQLFQFSWIRAQWME